MRRVQFQAGERIFSQGDRGDAAYMVVVGAVEISVERDGKSYSIGLIGPGGLFGEMAWIDRAPRSATAVARTNTTCAAYESDELSDLIQNPEVLVRIILTLIHRLRDTDRKYVDLIARIERASPTQGS
jgi:CRP/FNR family transcriptional regulator